MIYQPRIWASLELGWKAYITTRYTHLEIGLAQILAGIMIYYVPFQLQAGVDTMYVPSQIPSWYDVGYYPKFRAGIMYVPSQISG